ncbi:unnamed protein product [Miscanthus lutarioriparius]|uniref:Uncharacterized protein n=1 Tax=Miscanthus lutarioriparius TaxID=422564 RepID=A0A811R9L2_9POAL|nr:unnamed protein product [Miscanthus lutarioriparius]
MEAAVVTASHGAMGSLIAKLGDLLTAEYKLLKGAKGQILFLKAELESMHVFLKKISDTEQPDEQDKCWAKEVRELSYDIEDSVSEFMLRVEHKSSYKPHGFMGFINRSTKLLTTMNIRHDIAKEFEGLKVRVVEVRERRMRYQQTNDVAPRTTNTTIDLRLLAMYAEASGLVGMDGPTDELIQLMGGEDELMVLSIVGFGGLGKTTLANEIYCKLQGEFQCRAFVSVSQKPNIRKLLRTMLSQVGFVAPMDTNMEIWEETEFISALRKFLLKQRYLIVIDDIWEAFAWDIIRCALPESINGSRVLITTRIETVARGCCAKNIECVYKMKALSDQDSRSLFFKRIFGSEDGCPPYLKETCMLYLGIYPEDYTIEKNDLTRRWIAEDTNCNGEVMSCKVHDMMLDLILHKSQEENFVTVIDDIQDMTGQQDKIHRLSLSLGGTVGDRVAGCVQLSQTRTLAIFGTSSYLPPFQLFKYLRVLGIEITVQSYPPLLLDFTEIHHLFQLRYLKIVAKGHEVVLPSKIGSMQQLETFEINATIKLSKGQSFRELPSDIVHLSRLSHLIIPYDIILPNGIDIPWTQVLKGSWRWIIQLHNLYDLHLFVKQVLEEDVGILAQLPSVINLELFIKGTPEDKIIIHGSGFPVLKHFQFSCSRISCLAFVAGAMPKLEIKLELRFNARGWDRYGAAPTGTEHLSSLREIYVCIGGT